MAAWFVVTIPTAAYEQKLLADRDRHPDGERSPDGDRNVDGTKVIPPPEVGNVTGIVSLGLVQGSTLLQNRRQQDTNLNPNGLSVTSGNQAANESKRMSFISIASMLTRTLEELKVNDVVWSLTSNDKYHQVTFPAGKNNSESILQQLRTVGIGSLYDTKLSVLPCTLQYNSQETSSVENKGDNSDGDVNSDADTDGEKTAERGLLSKTSKSQKFIQSIKSRLAVAQVVEGVRESAVLSFDFIMFVLLAGMLAAIGLVENSSVVLVASMLVSPMMGPILAGTFGTVIQDRSLQRLGVKTELIGLGLCISFGFVFGLVYSSVGHWNDGFWLQNEMVARGQLRSLWVGVLIALPSGAGVALSILGGNAGSLVGVAISASLLPPVVNTGLLWASSLTKYIEFKISDNSTVLVPPATYIPTYSNNLAEEALLLGAVSFCLTMLNIFCIVLMGIIVLRIKEVTPDKEACNTSRFWSHDIKEVRNYNKTVAGKEAKSLLSQIHDELNAKLEQEENESDSWPLSIQQIFNDPVYQTVRMKSAYISPEITQMTWHPHENPPTEPQSAPISPEQTLAEKRAKFQRAKTEAPSSRNTGDPVVKIKLGTVTRERQLSFSTKTSTPSPTRRQGFPWNFPFQMQPNSRQGRFVISRADSRVEDVFNARRSRRGSKRENTAYLYDIHDLVP